MAHDADEQWGQPDWYQRLMDNRHLEALMIADADGRILRSTYPVSSSQDQLASMFQALEVLAQAMMHEFHADQAKVVHLMLRDCHVMLFPLLESRYFLMVQVERTAPLMLVMVELNRLIGDITLRDLTTMQLNREAAQLDGDLEAAELIDAVQEWLHNRPTRRL